ncbi:MAG: lipid-A-disaccharide synthase [SAR324 cluster bacterium]|nr:lipid-A-disaccharide synthase [SAR324 cluster bacterium]
MKLFMVAGEASGDSHGAALIRELKQRQPQLEFYGVGGPKMIQAGFRSIVPINQLQVHGLIEVLRHLPRMFRILKQLKQSLSIEKPEAAILIDYPGFNLKLAGHIKYIGIPVIFFNSPQVWAWRAGRLKTIVQVVDKMVVLFPFEEPIYRKLGMNVTFVGHPLLDEGIPQDQVQQFREPFHASGNSPLITIAPGSRPGEITRIMPVLAEAMVLLHQRFRQVRFLLPVSETLPVSLIEQYLENKSLPVSVLPGKFLECIYSADAAVVCSGTATLQTGLARIPFVIVYKVSALSFWIAKKLAKIQFIGMVNILAGRKIVEELLQNDLKAEAVFHEVVQLLEDRDYRQTMIGSLEEIRHVLGETGAYSRSADCMIEFLDHAEKLSSSTNV